MVPHPADLPVQCLLQHSAQERLGCWTARRNAVRDAAQRARDQRAFPVHRAADRSVLRHPRDRDDPGDLRGTARLEHHPLPVVTFEHVLADLGGIPANRLTDPQGLAGLLLAAANAAGLNPASPPVVKTGPRGVSAALLCHGGLVALQGLPEAGLCFADVAGLGGALPQRGLDVIVKRLGAREVRTDARRRGPVTQTTPPEAS